MEYSIVLYIYIIQLFNYSIVLYKVPIRVIIMFSSHNDESTTLGSGDRSVIVDPADVPTGTLKVSCTVYNYNIPSRKDVTIFTVITGTRKGNSYLRLYLSGMKYHFRQNIGIIEPHFINKLYSKVHSNDD